MCYSVMLREAFSLLSQYTVEQLKRNLDISPVSYVRSLLASDDPNLHYLFLVCLDSLDAETWSGSTDIFPSVLDDWEMEKIMHMIDSPDVLIRTKVKIITISPSFDRSCIIDPFYSERS
jgi:AP-4 complex subunit epsilon-1